MILSNKQQPSSWDFQLSWILTLNVVSHYGSWVWGTSKMYVLNLPSYLGIKIQCSYLGYLKCEAVNREIYADDSLSAIYYSLAIKKIGGKKRFLGGVQFHLFFPWFKKKESRTPPPSWRRANYPTCWSTSWPPKGQCCESFPVPPHLRAVQMFLSITNWYHQFWARLF